MIGRIELAHIRKTTGQQIDEEASSYRGMNWRHCVFLIRKFEMRMKSYTCQLTPPAVGHVLTSERL